jgi:hypothetical protein
VKAASNNAASYCGHSKKYCNVCFSTLLQAQSIIFKMETKRQAIPRLNLHLDKPFNAFIFAFILYFAFSTLAGSPFRVRVYAYFNYLADAFLHGQLNLRLIPSSIHDLSFYNGNYYLYWPPMPAVVLMPFVALFGVGFSDVFFSVVVASGNVAVVAALLHEVDRAGLFRLDENYRTLLVLFFALGTVHITLAPFGNVWFTAQLLGFLFVGLAYLSAIKLKGAVSFLAVGTFMTFAMLTRNHLVFTGIWPAYYLISKHWYERPKLYSYLALALLPALVGGSLFLTYNYARFGNPFELGIQYHHMSSFFVEDYGKFGAFNWHYLPINFYYQYIYYPLPLTAESYMGGSLFLLSPVFFYAFRSIYRGYRDPNILMLILSILATSAPILLLMGTGWVQYGPRYTLDFTIPLLLLTAVGVQSTSKRVLLWLTVFSILQYILGLRWLSFTQL